MPVTTAIYIVLVIAVLLLHGCVCYRIGYNAGVLSEKRRLLLLSIIRADARYRAAVVDAVFKFRQWRDAT